jgi:hypothetical protein
MKKLYKKNNIKMKNKIIFLIFNKIINNNKIVKEDNKFINIPIYNNNKSKINNNKIFHFNLKLA